MNEFIFHFNFLISNSDCRVHKFPYVQLPFLTLMPAEVFSLFFPFPLSSSLRSPPVLCFLPPPSLLSFLPSSFPFPFLFSLCLAYFLNALLEVRKFFPMGMLKETEVTARDSACHYLIPFMNLQTYMGAFSVSPNYTTRQVLYRHGFVCFLHTDQIKSDNQAGSFNPLKKSPVLPLGNFETEKFKHFLCNVLF